MQPSTRKKNTDFQYFIIKNQYLNAEKCLYNQNTEIQYLNTEFWY